MGEVLGPRHARVMPPGPWPNMARLDEIDRALAWARPHLGRCPVFLELVLEAATMRLLVLGRARLTDGVLELSAAKDASVWWDVIELREFLARQSLPARVETEDPVPDAPSDPFADPPVAPAPGRHAHAAAPDAQTPPRRVVTTRLNADALGKLVEQRTRTYHIERGRHRRRFYQLDGRARRRASAAPRETSGT